MKCRFTDPLALHILYIRDLLMGWRKNPLRINAVQFIRPVGLGSTKPQLFRCDDGFDYVIKLGLFNRAKKALVNELIAYRLGKLLDLPLPKYRIVHVPKQLIDLTPISERFKISPGPAFGSRYIPHAIFPLTKEAISKCTNVKKAADMIVFDLWINNIDRRGSNLLIEGEKNYQMFLIDQGHSLYLPGWTIKDLQEKVTVFQNNWPRLYHLFIPYIDSDHPFDQALQRVTSLAKRKIEESVKDIPLEWKVSEKELELLAEGLEKRRFLIERKLLEFKGFFPQWNRT